MSQRYKCKCVDVEIGTHANTMQLAYPSILKEYAENRAKTNLPTNGITVDKCIVDDVLLLWAHNVATYGSCCGHNKTMPMINIDPKKMGTAMLLGFKPYLFKDDPDRLGTIIPKSLKKIVYRNRG